LITWAAAIAAGALAGSAATVAQVESALRTEMHQYDFKGMEMQYGHNPAALQSVFSKCR